MSFEHVGAAVEVAIVAPTMMQNMTMEMHLASFMLIYETEKLGVGNVNVLWKGGGLCGPCLSHTSGRLPCLSKAVLRF